MYMYKLLIIEDDRSLNRALAFDLSKEGYAVDSLYLGYEALEKNIDDYAIIILDVNLPDINGFELFKLLKVKKFDISVVFLSACDLDIDILKGYDLGAEEYITKPFNTKILHHKINRILNRNINRNSQEIIIDNRISYNISSCEVLVDKHKITLTPIELKLFNFFIKNANHILPRDAIINYLWDMNNNYVDEHTLTVNIKRLRNKIENEDNKYIKTVYGIGYIWSCEKNEKD